MQTAKWDLGRIPIFIEEENIWFSCKSRSITSVIEFYKNKGKLFSDEQAAQFILNGLKQLTAEDFSRQTLCFEIECDEYGKMIDGYPWYIKFSFKDDSGTDCLNSLSFHPPEKEIVTRSGKIPKGENV